MGGSFGIALINTYIAKRASNNRTSLIAHVTESDALTHERMQSFIGNFMSHGATYLRAVQQSLGALENIVVRQTFLLSYMDAFLLLAILNASCIPLVLITIKKRSAAKAPVKMTISDH
jgi:DHA2 family multidrug resistance protein